MTNLHLKTSFYLLIVSLLVCSCAAVGTKTLYKTSDNIQVHKIGYVKLAGDTILESIFPQTDSIFSSSITKTFNEYGVNPVGIEDYLPFESPGINKIRGICKEYNLDGLIISKIKFIHVTYSIYFIPYAQNYDTEVEMKLYDKNGNMLVKTLHNTLKGNTYKNPPSVNMTIADGAKGALKRIAKEMGLTK